MNGYLVSETSIVADVTAPNGFHLQLNTAWDDFAEACTWDWSVPNATAIPADTSPPVILLQPQAVIAHAHDSVSFSVTADVPPLLAYQWTLNGTNISGAKSNTLTITNVTQSDLGNYAVVVTNAFAAITSSNALLSMYPHIEVPFGGAITYWGKPATLSVEGWGTGPLSYQWFKDGVVVPTEPVTR